MLYLLSNSISTNENSAYADQGVHAQLLLSQPTYHMHPHTLCVTLQAINKCFTFSFQAQKTHRIAYIHVSPG